MTTDNLVQGAVRWLRAFPDVTAVLGADPQHEPYLFQHKLWAVLEGTSSTAAVISRVGGWAGANVHNTMRFPRLSLELIADPQRDAGFNIRDPGEVHRRINHAYEVIDARLHRPQGETQMWGTVRTIGCIRMAEPADDPVPDGDGLLHLQVFYGVIQA